LDFENGMILDDWEEREEEREEQEKRRRSAVRASLT
jgi:hypothetical protein